jgi:hypothetical protein
MMNQRNFSGLWYRYLDSIPEFIERYVPEKVRASMNERKKGNPRIAFSGS